MFGMVLGILSLSAKSTLYSAVLFITLLSIKVAVLVHQSVLMNDFKVSNLFKWSKCDSKYFIKSILLVIVIGMITAFILSIFSSSKIVLIIVLMLIGLIMARILIIFPATAVDEDMRLSFAWNLSKGYTGSLFFLLICIPAITNKLIEYIPINSTYTQMFYFVFSVLIILFEITLLSHCYQSFEDSPESIESDSLIDTKTLKK
jgi:hypothetical protein